MSNRTPRTSPWQQVLVSQWGTFFYLWVLIWDGEEFMNVKKPTTFEEQVSIIKSKGFIVNNEEKCLDLLHRVNYYALSAYFLPFKIDKNSYQKNVDFTKVEKIYQFDRKIRTLIFSIAETIEVYLRAQFSYYYAHKYGPLGYLESSNYSKLHRHNEFLEKKKKRMYRASKQDFGG